MKKNSLIFLLGLASLALLAACNNAREATGYGSMKNIDTTIGIKQRSDVTDKKVTEIENELRAKGVSIISVGQDYRIVIPAELIYIYRSPRLEPTAFDIVNLVVDYIKQFRIVSMRIDVFSQDKDKKRAGALGFARARTLVQYLWSQEIDTRLLYNQAHIMNRAPNTCCNDQMGRGDSPTRVEIIFRNAVV